GGRQQGHPGRHRGLRGAACVQQRDAGLPELWQAEPDQARRARERGEGPAVPPVRRALRACAEDRGAVTAKARATAPESPSPASRATSPARGEGRTATAVRVPNLAREYREKAVGALTKEFDYTNIMEVPRVAKVIVNIGIGEAKDNVRALESAVEDVRTI